jgi:hypothetical protein
MRRCGRCGAIWRCFCRRRRLRPRERGCHGLDAGRPFAGRHRRQGRFDGWRERSGIFGGCEERSRREERRAGELSRGRGSCDREKEEHDQHDQRSVRRNLCWNSEQLHDYCGGQAGGGTFGSPEDGALQRSPESGLAGTGAFRAGAVVASPSLIGRVSSVVVGLSGAGSVGEAEDEGGTTGAAVVSGEARSTEGASVVPQAAPTSATNSGTIQIGFMAF